MFEPSTTPRVFAVPLGVDFPAALVRGLSTRTAGHPPEALAQAAASAPFAVFVDGARDDAHPLAKLIRRPNPEQSGAELMEAVYGALQVSGNAYVEATGDLDVHPRRHVGLGVEVDDESPHAPGERRGGETQSHGRLADTPLE